MNKWAPEANVNVNVTRRVGTHHSVRRYFSARTPSLTFGTCCKSPPPRSASRCRWRRLPPRPTSPCVPPPPTLCTPLQESFPQAELRFRAPIRRAPATTFHRRGKLVLSCAPTLPVHPNPRRHAQGFRRRGQSGTQAERKTVIDSPDANVSEDDSCRLWESWRSAASCTSWSRLGPSRCATRARWTARSSAHSTARARCASRLRRRKAWCPRVARWSW